jgi:hypothetical protein
VLVGACVMAVDAAISSWVDGGMDGPVLDAFAQAERDLRRIGSR